MIPSLIQHSCCSDLLVTNYRMWPIGLFEFLYLFRAEFYINCLEDLFHMMCFGGADNRRGHASACSIHAQAIWVGVTR